MKGIVFLAVAACVLIGSAHGQRPDSFPQFEKYPAAVLKRTARAIDFRNSPGASSFRTRLREALKGEVNFAGRYIITGWGCGTGCSHSAIIDAKTGRVYFPDELLGVSAAYGDLPDDYEVYSYRKDSRLLIIRGKPGPDVENARNRKQGTYYFEWRANRLRLLRFVPDPGTPNV